MPSIFRFCLLLSIGTLVSSCGFALRGSDLNPLAEQTLSLVSDQANSPLTAAIVQTLQAERIQVMSTEGSATYQLHVGEETFLKQASTVNGRARAAQYHVVLSAPVALERQGEVLLTQETLSVERDLFFDSFNAAGSLEEEALLLEEMRRQFAVILLRRLQALASLH